MIVTIVSWLAVAVVLLTYLSGRMRAYDWVNVIACVPVALPALLLGAYSSATISLVFGLIGAIHIVRQHHMHWFRKKTNDN